LGRWEAGFDHCANHKGAGRSLLIQEGCCFVFYILVVVSCELNESVNGSFDGKGEQTSILSVSDFVWSWLREKEDLIG
jgi:hypothetical protein